MWNYYTGQMHPSYSVKFAPTKFYTWSTLAFRQSLISFFGHLHHCINEFILHYDAEPADLWNLHPPNLYVFRFSTWSSGCWHCYFSFWFLSLWPSAALHYNQIALVFSFEWQNLQVLAIQWMMHAISIYGHQAELEVFCISIFYWPKPPMCKALNFQWAFHPPPMWIHINFGKVQHQDAHTKIYNFGEYQQYHLRTLG